MNIYYFIHHRYLEDKRNAASLTISGLTSIEEISGCFFVRNAFKILKFQRTASKVYLRLSWPTSIMTNSQCFKYFHEKKKDKFKSK